MSAPYSVVIGEGGASRGDVVVIEEGGINGGANPNAAPIWHLLRLIMWMVLVGLLIGVLVYVTVAEPARDHRYWHRIRNETRAMRDAVCQCVDDAKQWLHVEINNLLAAYLGDRCFIITEVPYIIPYSHRCYRLGGNMTVTTAPSGGYLILGQNVRHIQIYGDGYEMDVTGVVTRGLLLVNVTDVLADRIACTSRTQILNPASRCIQTSGGSRMITVQDVYSNNLTVGIIPFDSDVRVRGGFISGRSPGSGESASDVIGLFAIDPFNIDVDGLVVDILYTSQATLFDGLTAGVAVVRNSNKPFGPQGPAHIANVRATATYPFTFHRGQNVIGRDLRGTMDPLSIFGVGAQMPGSTGPFDGSSFENVVINVEGNNLAADGTLIWNARASVIKSLIVHGAVRPLPGFHRGALVSIGVQYSSVDSFPQSLFRVQAVSLKDVAVSATTDETLAIAVSGGLAGSRMDVLIDGGVISGGLVGVALLNSTSKVHVRNVKVTNAVYGFAALNYSHGNLLESNSAFNCCRSFYADNTTYNNVFYNNRAIEPAGSAYADLAPPGANNRLAVGLLWNMNTEEAPGDTACAEPLPWPLFDPYEGAMESSSSSWSAAPSFVPEVDGGDGIDLKGALQAAGASVLRPDGAEASELELRVQWNRRLRQRYEMTVPQSDF